MQPTHAIFAGLVAHAGGHNGITRPLDITDENSKHVAFSLYLFCDPNFIKEPWKSFDLLRENST